MKKSKPNGLLFCYIIVYSYVIIRSSDLFADTL